MTTAFGILLCLVGVGLVGAAARTVWRGMVGHAPPSPPDRSQLRNAAGAALYYGQRPTVAKVRITRRRKTQRRYGESKE